MNKQKINVLCISVHTLKHKTHKILNETFKTNKTLNTGLKHYVFYSWWPNYPLGRKD